MSRQVSSTWTGEPDDDQSGERLGSRPSGALLSGKTKILAFILSVPPLKVQQALSACEIVELTDRLLPLVEV